MDVRKDLFLVLVLFGLKLTIFPDMEWWMVAVPLIVGFGYNFIKGFINGMIEGHEDRKEK